MLNAGEWDDECTYGETSIICTHWSKNNRVVLLTIPPTHSITCNLCVFLCWLTPAHASIIACNQSPYGKVHEQKLFCIASTVFWTSKLWVCWRWVRAWSKAGKSNWLCTVGISYAFYFFKYLSIIFSTNLGRSTGICLYNSKVTNLAEQ